MPDKRSHRGRHPEDDRLFAPAMIPRLREAVGDLSWLLIRGYAEKSSLKIVGDRFELTERQRTAVMRCACSDSALARRRRHQVGRHELGGVTLLLDGYNVLTTVEAALARGVIIVGRDGCYRDMASMHGTFRKVEETRPAIALLGEVLRRLGVARCVWYLDSPVSNSGRLRQSILETSGQQDGTWEVHLAQNPDALLAEADEVVASADSVILDRCRRWFNLAREVVTAMIPDSAVIDLSYVATPTPSPR